jgi:hypothetical protein
MKKLQMPTIIYNSVSFKKSGNWSSSRTGFSSRWAGRKNLFAISAETTALAITTPTMIEYCGFRKNLTA